MTIKVLKVPLDYLSLWGIWPKRSEELKPSKFYHIRFAITIILALCPVGGSIAHLYLITPYLHDMGQVLETLSITISECGVLYFTCSFYYYQSESAKSLNALSDFEKYGKPPNVEKIEKRMSLLAQWYKYLIDLVVLTYFFQPFIMKRRCERLNETRTVKDICGTVAPIYLPFNFNIFPLNVIIYFWQLFTVFIGHQGASITSFIIFGNIQYLLTRVRHLKILLQQTLDTKEKDLRDKRILVCILYHIDILNWGKQIDKAYKACTFVHVVLTAIMFGLSGFSLLNIPNPNVISLGLGWFLATIIVNINAQFLLDETVEMVNILFHGQWYEYDVDFQKKIYFMIMRMQTPIVLHAGAFGILSFAVVVGIVKTGYSYIALLNATSK